MNHMKQVAHMLGVELNEEFRIKYSSHRNKLTERGLEFYNEFYNEWRTDSNGLIRLIFGEYKIEKPILDETEKRYLSNVIKPFRNKIKYIAKYIDDREYICIIYKDLNGGTFSMAFPSYDEGTMYKGMEVGKAYTLDELGL